MMDHVQSKESSTPELERIRNEYRRRQQELVGDRYAPWNPAETLMRDERRRVAAQLLHRASRFPTAGDRCLEIGFGTLGWLADLLGWGLRESDLHGIELDSRRAAVAQRAFPSAKLHVGDASQLPWADQWFQLIVVSTVFTSILEATMRQRIAAEIVRVLAPRGVVLWYDFRVNNPRNPNVRRVTRGELRSLFPTLDCKSRAVTLAPPLARCLAARSYPSAVLASALPVLRTHWLAVLTRP